MKVERTKGPGGTRAVGAAAYSRQVEAAAAIQPVAAGSAASATVHGIPESEFTPRVRDAIMSLMAEVDSLRQELNQTKTRLEVAEKTADQDHLLPLLNRRAFVRELTRYIGFSDRYGTPASLVYFDLDGFKAINDTYGHAGGDAVLKYFAETLNSNIRDSDLVGRLGGDEFGIILSHATQEQAHKKADTLAEKLKATPVEWDGQKIALAFSYGAFELRAGESADNAMARADEAMYAHKRISK